jgi:hypothetical protein
MKPTLTLMATLFLVSGCALAGLHPGYESEDAYRLQPSCNYTHSVDDCTGQGRSGTRFYGDNGEFVGFQQSDGRIYDSNGKFVGSQGEDGRIYDKTGSLLLRQE